ncbi:MAG TPA: heme ABC exporter ATP-binding protein CcmA [Candidatus Dormibacteraeota bacterium]|nr:heme ABC exporter ATP-binding protein CcmA [Candidatus Dormibacteraeota bacterium]
MAIRYISPAAVRLRGVSRAFDLVPAMSRVDLEVDAGEVVLIRGPNGAGKSTLLRIVATALSPTAGTGQVLGFDLLSQREEIRRRTELVSHRTRLYEDLTALENLRFAATIHGADPCRAGAALERMGLARVSRETVRGFSQGMRQRLALARAVLRGPELLLLDEPYAGLDPEARELVDDLVTAARSEGRTVLLVTHGGARPGLATRSVLMRGGRLHALAPGEPALAVPG